MAHVILDESGAVSAIFGSQQENSIDIADDDPRITAFMNMNNPIQIEIDRLERDSMMNRGVRELSLRLMEDKALMLSNGDQAAANAYLQTVPAYVKFKALDDQITALRAQL